MNNENYCINKIGYDIINLNLNNNKNITLTDRFSYINWYYSNLNKDTYNYNFKELVNESAIYLIIIGITAFISIILPFLYKIDKISIKFKKIFENRSLFYYNINLIFYIFLLITLNVIVIYKTYKIFISKDYYIHNSNIIIQKFIDPKIDLKNNYFNYDSRNNWIGFDLIGHLKSHNKFTKLNNKLNNDYKLLDLEKFNNDYNNAIKLIKNSLKRLRISRNDLNDEIKTNNDFYEYTYSLYSFSRSFVASYNIKLLVMLKQSINLANNYLIKTNEANNNMEYNDIFLRFSDEYYKYLNNNVSKANNNLIELSYLLLKVLLVIVFIIIINLMFFILIITYYSLSNKIKVNSLYYYLSANITLVLFYIMIIISICLLLINVHIFLNRKNEINYINSIKSCNISKSIYDSKDVDDVCNVFKVIFKEEDVNYKYNNILNLYKYKDYYNLAKLVKNVFNIYLKDSFGKQILIYYLKEYSKYFVNYIIKDKIKNIIDVININQQIKKESVNNCFHIRCLIQLLKYKDYYKIYRIYSYIKYSGEKIIKNIAVIINNIIIHIKQLFGEYIKEIKNITQYNNLINVFNRNKKSEILINLNSEANKFLISDFNFFVYLYDHFNLLSNSIVIPLYKLIMFTFFNCIFMIIYVYYLNIYGLNYVLSKRIK